MQSVKGMLHTFQAMISPANIKLKIAEMQQMSFPELVIGFFKLFFYIFYYSGFGVATVLK
jgi:ryanodine receptor 2